MSSCNCNCSGPPCVCTFARLGFVDPAFKFSPDVLRLTPAQIWEAAVAVATRAALVPLQMGSMKTLPSVRLPDARPRIQGHIGRGRTLRLLMLAVHAEFERASKSFTHSGISLHLHPSCHKGHIVSPKSLVILPETL